MFHIQLNEEQARLVTTSLEPIQIQDPSGRLLGILQPVWTAEDIADAKKRLASDEPRFTTEQVLEYARSQVKK